MAQSFSSIYIHLVFATKHREPRIDDSIRLRLHQYACGVMMRLSCPVIRLNSRPDHLHILFDHHRTSTLSKTVEELKTTTSRWMKSQYSLPDFAWQVGYAAFSVDPRSLQHVKSYIENQEAHHRVSSSLDELRDLAASHGFTVDEDGDARPSA